MYGTVTAIDWTQSTDDIAEIEKILILFAFNSSRLLLVFIVFLSSERHASWMGTAREYINPDQQQCTPSLRHSQDKVERRQSFAIVVCGEEKMGKNWSLRQYNTLLYPTKTKCNPEFVIKESLYVPEKNHIFIQTTSIISLLMLL